MKIKNLFTNKLRLKLEKLGKEADLYRQIAENSLNDVKKAQSVAKTGTWKWYIVENRVEWSDEMYNIFGVSKDTFTGDLSELISSRIHPEDRQKVYDSNNSVIGKGKPVAVDYRIVLPDGIIKTVWAEAGALLCDNDSHPSILTGIVKDITDYVNLQHDLLRAKKAAEENESKYRMFIDQTSEGIYLLEVDPPARIDTPLEELVDYLYDKSILTECNNSFMLMYGAKDKSELIGKTLMDFHGGRDNPVNREEARRFVRNGFRINNERTVEKDSEGKLHFFSNSSMGIVRDGYILSVWGTQADITNLFEKEAELLKAKEKAEESDRLKTAFLNNMSHEIRTPLNGIVGFSQLLADPSLPDEKKEEFAGMVTKCSEKLIDIISDVTEMSKIQANEIMLEYSEFNLNACISEILAGSADDAKRKNISISFESEFPYEKSIIRSDKPKVKKIFSHLVRNAVKFTRKGFVEVTCAVENGNLIVTVKDSGIGIHPSIISDIFEPFRQFESEGGNGLGLAIARAYAEALGGEIRVQSEPGSGSTFVTILPLLAPENSEIMLQIRPADETPLDEMDPGLKRILIAEDENINFLYLKELLQSETTEVIRACNGKEAVDICRENENIDLILMDFMMPVMDGRSAAIEIKDFRPGLPIILQTAYTIDSDKTDVRVFDDYIPKPIKSEVLRQKLNRFVNL